MKVTLPHMGNLYVPFKGLFREFGVEYIVPPPSSKRTMSLGVQYSPEFVCVPFKLTLGNFIEALELGADTLIMAAGPGLCRFGYYAKLQEKILRDLKWDFEMVTTEPFEGGRITGIVNKLRFLCGNPPLLKLIGAVKFGLEKIAVLDELEKTVHGMRARELVKGTATDTWKEAIDAVAEASDYRTLNRLKRNYQEKLKSIPTDHETEPLRVGIIGEFYVVLDPFVNMDVEVELGKLGVETVRSMFIGEWTKLSLFLSAIGIKPKQKIFRAASPYLTRDVGGEGWESVGETVLAARHGLDGMVHLSPFTCMPEVIAQNILPDVRRDVDIPVLTVTCDEQMGRTGVITRLEAFVDLLKRRRHYRMSKQGAGNSSLRSTLC